MHSLFFLILISTFFGRCRATVSELDVALNRPCEPLPSCGTLLDGNSSTCLGCNDQPTSSQLRGSLEASSLTRFKVFLGSRKSLSRIVILCGGSQASLSEVQLLHRPMQITLWPLQTLLLSPRISREVQDATLRLEFAIEEREARIVSLDSGDSSLASGGLCGRLPIIEVSVMSSGASSSPQARRQAELLLRAHSHEDMSTEMASAQEEDTTVEVRGSDASDSRPLLLLRDSPRDDGFLAPKIHDSAITEVRAYERHVVEEQADMIFLFGCLGLALILPTLIACPRARKALLQNLSVFAESDEGCGHYASSSLELTPLVLIPQPLVSALDQISSASVTSPTLIGTISDNSEVSYFYIGDDSDVAEDFMDEEAERLAEGTTSTRASSNSSSSTSRPEDVPVVIPTESEPEAELYPNSGCSTPRGNVDGSSSSHVTVRCATAAALADPLLEHQGPCAGSGRVLMLYSSPLCRLDATRGPVPMPLIPFEKEFEEVLVASKDEASSSRQRTNVPVTLTARLLTASSLQRALSPGVAGSTILHLSAHGVNGSLIVEDGRGTAHALSCQLLRDMLALRKETPPTTTCPRLLVVNACSSLPAGQCFADSGIPHVVCATSDLKDSWSSLFLRSLYSTLFHGSSVSSAFASAVMSLRCDPSIPAIASSCFALLPEQEDHSEILFPIARPTSVVKRTRISFAQAADSSSSGREDTAASRTPSATSSDSDDTFEDNNGTGNFSDGTVLWLRKKAVQPISIYGKQNQRSSAACSFHKPVPRDLTVELQRLPFEQRLPCLPEDFLGRSVDVWSILQHLGNRRIVLVCNSTPLASCARIGKSVLLDAVHRSAALRLGSRCVSIKLVPSGRKADSAHIGPSEQTLKDGRFFWLAQIHLAVRQALLEERTRYCRSGSSHKVDFHRKTLASAKRKHADVGDRQHINSTYQEHIRALAKDLQDLGIAWRRNRSSSAFHESTSRTQRKLRSESTSFGFGTRAPAPFSGGPGVLLLLHRADDLLKRPFVQELLADLLQHCPLCRVVLSSGARLHATGGSQFKVIHYELAGLNKLDAARLFLRRTHRSLTWEEIMPIAGIPTPTAMSNSAPKDTVRIDASSELEVLSLIAAQPTLASCKGIPGAIVALASNFETLR